MAVIYEVTLHARAEIADAYLAWLREHIAAMLALQGFEGAELHALDAGSADEHGWCVRYRLRDRAALNAYLHDHAPRMRAEGIERFGDAFRAERRILIPLDR
ncbi:MAG TPA: DUF4286 family protein [Xanthomonadaceae bacterium]|nr:DUF4286 family protein [Xanthomonadaceae bacterium]